ncbi:MAG: cation-translocating P-type ATPase [Nanoarchaeota archaeon]|nr:cation-translocating P-type ATPase [Nanoarchaeota archaeon]
MAEAYHALNEHDVFEKLSSSKQGLSSEDAKKRIEEFGLNELKQEKKATAITIFFEQFKNTFLMLLIFAVIVSLVLGEYIEAVAMSCIIMLSVILGFIQEFRAEKAMEALQKRSALIAKVYRDGEMLKIPAKDLVPGDVVCLEAGDIVPADLRLYEVSSLQIEEASLTGESVPPKKYIVKLKEETQVNDQTNMAFMSTSVSYGKGRGIVVRTGMNTEMGKIAKSIQETEEQPTPLQVKFQKMAKQIGFAIIGLIILLSVIRFAQGGADIKMILLVALSLAVAAVPNALPVIVTISLSMGSNTLAKQNMLVKKLPAAESLGSVTIICSDKTGTITKNEMTVTELYCDKKVISVTGTGYEPKGDFYHEQKPFSHSHLDLFMRIGALCNNAKLKYDEKEKSYDIIGDPTEGSLIVLARKGKLEEEHLRKNFTFVDELPFDSDRKRMTVIFDNKLDKKREAYTKGAPDLLLKTCDRILENGHVRKLTKEDIHKILDMNNSFAERALRVLAFAYKDMPTTKAVSKESKESNEYIIDDVENDLIFVGLVGMIDPPRDEVKKAVEECRTAGIEVMIITGDHAITTKAVASKIGLMNEGDIVLTGEELDKLSDEDLIEKIDKIRIIARALPIQKLRIVDALQKKGHIVAMTGDGVNDAPALKKADIGIAMGITGTDVAKEVSNATLVDDNFATIVKAVSEGRNIYDKMIKSTRYLLACNMGEIASVFIAVILSMPVPMVPLQILLMNLLTDSLPAMGLGMEKSENDVMKRPPRDPKENPITASMFTLIIVFGLIMGVGTVYMFNIYLAEGLTKAQTVAFTTLVAFEMFAVLSSRSLYLSWRDLNVFSNIWLIGAVILSFGIQVLVIYVEPLQIAFGTTNLLFIDWLRILGIASLGFIVMEISKLFVKFKSFDARR